MSERKNKQYFNKGGGCMTESIWNGFKRLDFLFEGREAVLVFPENANENKNWLLKMKHCNQSTMISTQTTLNWKT